MRSASKWRTSAQFKSLGQPKTFRRWLPGTLADVRRGRPQKDQREAVKSVISTYQWFRTDFAADPPMEQTECILQVLSARVVLLAEVKGPKVDQGGLEKANPFSLRDQWFESISLQQRV